MSKMSCQWGVRWGISLQKYGSLFMVIYIWSFEQRSFINIHYNITASYDTDAINYTGSAVRAKLISMLIKLRYIALAWSGVTRECLRDCAPDTPLCTIPSRNPQLLANSRLRSFSSTFTELKVKADFGSGGQEMQISMWRMRKVFVVKYRIRLM